MNFKLTRNWYEYVDDTGDSWAISCTDGLAEAGGLRLLGPGELRSRKLLNRRLRHMKLVALAERPGRHKYKADVVTNERNPSKLLNKIFSVNGYEMRCVKFVGERRPLYRTL